MNKTLQEIIDQMFAAKNADANLAELNSTSKVSVFGSILKAVGFVIFNFQEAAKLHFQEIKTLISEQKVPTLRWYRNQALKFQYGFNLLLESDQFSPTFDDGTGTIITATEEQILTSKIIKYAAVTKAETSSKISMKIAPENGNDIFDDNQMTAFGKYIEEIQAAGDNIVIVNYLPDILKINFNIVYDPLILLANGTSILNANEPVKEAIKKFLKNLPFNGELSVQKLEAAVLAVEGVLDLQNLQVSSKWIEAGIGYGFLQPINISVIPKSGRFTLIDNVTNTEDWSGLNYIV